MGHKQYMKQKSISIEGQRTKIQQMYHGLIIKIDTKKGLQCVMYLQPSVNSVVYTVKIVYTVESSLPKVWLISPELKKYDGELPHHIYSVDVHGNYELCVCNIHEWDKNMYIADSFIPWICTWLNTYEYWLITGKWHYEEAFPKSKKNRRLGQKESNTEA